MKKKILVIVLCLAFVATYGQQRRRRRATNTTPATTSRTQTTNRPPATNLAADTTRKVAAAPAKPFDRPLDGYYKKTNILNAKVTPYPNLRESDVAYEKRVWREVDVRDKMNQFMASPKQRLIDIFMAAIADGELTAYDATPTKEDPDADSFRIPLTAAQAKLKMADSVMVDKFDPNTGVKTGSVMQPGDFQPDSIVKFRIKEDWVFDRQRSVFEPRIIGIAPMVRPSAGGVKLDYQPAFWIRFPDARPILATKEAVNRNNDNTGLSYDDVFMKRIFASYITKVSNDANNRIKDYAQGMDKLYEAERIKKDLMNWELNLWQY